MTTEMGEKADAPSDQSSKSTIRPVGNALTTPSSFGKSHPPTDAAASFESKVGSATGRDGDTLLDHAKRAIPDQTYDVAVFLSWTAVMTNTVDLCGNPIAGTRQALIPSLTGTDNVYVNTVANTLVTMAPYLVDANRPKGRESMFDLPWKRRLPAEEQG